MCAQGKGMGNEQKAKGGEEAKRERGSAQGVGLAVRVPWTAENNLQSVQRTDQLLQHQVKIGEGRKGDDECVRRERVRGIGKRQSGIGEAKEGGKAQQVGLAV